MHIRKLLLTAALIATTAATVPATALASDPPTAAMKYEACMNEAEEKFNQCLEKSITVAEAFCWSRYGWAKLGCSVDYAYNSLRGRK
jgi:hypothetical protein